MELKAFKAAFNELDDLDEEDPKKGKKRIGGARLSKLPDSEDW